MRALLSNWRWFGLHFALYALVVGYGLWYGFGEDGTSWFAIAWTGIVGLHFLCAKTLNVDDDWAESRAYDLRQKTYDHKHIDQIVDSAVDHDHADDPAAPRRH